MDALHRKMPVFRRKSPYHGWQDAQPTSNLTGLHGHGLHAMARPGARYYRRQRIPPRPVPPQETGFLNRRIELAGVTYRFQVYLPEDWRRDDGKKWPIILSLHGRGERGSEGMWQTQIGLAEAVRNHPERWPFVIVMPQCPLNAHWTDPPDAGAGHGRARPGGG